MGRPLRAAPGKENLDQRVAEVLRPYKHVDGGQGGIETPTRGFSKSDNGGFRDLSINHLQRSPVLSPATPRHGGMDTSLNGDQE